jgi:RNA recognition motif-containing protein
VIPRIVNDSPGITSYVKYFQPKRLSERINIFSYKEFSMNIYVGNLSPEITEDDLRLEFVNFGIVTSVALMNDSGIGSGQNRGCGYVEMPSVKEGECAVESLQGKSLKGRKVDIIKSLPVTHDSTSKRDPASTASGFFRKTKYWGDK